MLSKERSLNRENLGIHICRRAGNMNTKVLTITGKG